MPRQSFAPTHRVIFWRSPRSSPNVIPVLVDEHGVGHSSDGERIVRLVGEDWHWARGGHPGPSRLEVVRPTGRPARAGVAATRRIDLKATPDEEALWRAAAEQAGVGLRRWIADAATEAARKLTS